MLRAIITLYEGCQKSIADSPVENRITLGYLKTTLAPLIMKVVDSKFVDPKLPPSEIKVYYDDLASEISDAFQSLGDF